MKRAIVDRSLSTKPCCFYASGDSGTFPILNIDTLDKVQPCSAVIPSNEIQESLAIGFIATGVCELQRKFDVCPRGLGLEVDPLLIPLNQRK